MSEQNESAPVPTFYNHNAESALRAAFAAANACVVLLRLMLDEQKPADPGQQARHFHEAQALLQEACKWVAGGPDSPQAD